MKLTLTISRRDLAKKNYTGAPKQVISGEASPLPDEARLIAEVIKNILLKEGS